MGPIDTTPADRARPGSIPWRRLWQLARPSRLQLAALLGIGLAGSAAGIVPAFALGRVVDALTRHSHAPGVLLPLVVLGTALVAEALCYVVADGLYGRVTGRLGRDLRLRMLTGALRSRTAESGLASRFVSDAEAPAELTVGSLDMAVTGGLQLGLAVAAIAFVSVTAAGLVLALGAVVLIAGRWLQRAAGDTAAERQETLELMSRALARRTEPGGRARFHSVVERLFRLDARLGWDQARGSHIPGIATGAGPFAIVLAAAATHTYRAGALVALFALADRAFRAADDLLDVSLDIELVRGAIARCFELIDRGLPARSSA